MGFRFHLRRRRPVVDRRCHCQHNEESRAGSIPLDQAPPGSEVEVCCIGGSGRVPKRLAELGFVPGTPVRVVRKAPLADPVEYELRGYLVSLRREEAALVNVKTAAHSEITFSTAKSTGSE